MGWLDFACVLCAGSTFAVALALAIGRRRIVRELESSSEASRVLFDTSPIAMVAFDTETLRFESVNEAALKLYGYTRERFLELTLLDLKPGSDVPAMHAAMEAGEGKRTTFTATVGHVRSDRTLVTVDVSSREVVVRGRAKRMVAVIDRTEHQKLEAQLRQAQQMEAVGRLAGGIAHDFNNMLSVILGFAWSLLEDMSESDPAYAQLTEIKHAADRSAELTRQLLAFSRCQPQRPRVIDLNDVVVTTEALIRRIVGEDIRVATHLAPIACTTKVDAGQIDQVIMNLVVNARDAMRSGGDLVIETSIVEYDAENAVARRGLEPGRYVVISVSDTGVGMDIATRAHAFEPFFTTKPFGEGTGLGLSIVFGIVQKHGGHVTVESEPDRGTRIECHFPATDQRADPSVRQTVAPRSMRGDETILLVEDEEAVLLVVERLLRRNGYRVLTARHPGEAIVLCERHPGLIDLLITDVIMPQMSGRELAERLVATRPSMKVIYTSGYTDDVALDARASGAFLQKPVSPDLFARTIRDVLSTSSHAGASEIRRAG